MAAPPLYQTGAQIVTTLAGTERIGIDNGGSEIAVTTANAVVAFTNVNAQVFNANTAVASATLTAANISGGTDSVILNLSGTLTGAANATLAPWAR